MSSLFRSQQHPLRWLAAGIAALCLAAPAVGQEAKDKPAGIRPLFDGKTLDGWKSTGGSGAGELAVADGAIVLKAGSPMTAIVCTKGDLPTVDYELIYEARRDDGSDFFAAVTFPVAKAFVTWVNGGWGGTVTGLSSIDGADASENETNSYFKYENGVWYRFKARVTAKTIRAWIDDKQVVALELDGRLLTTRLETRSQQPLGFSAWRTTSSIRKVEVRPLTPAEIAENDKPIP